MAVVTKYVVVRKGVELDRVFSVKKEAEAFDRMLDAADALGEFIREGGFGERIDSECLEALAVHLAQNAPEVVRILKGVRPVPVAAVETAGREPVKKPAPAGAGKKSARGPRRKKGR